MLRTDRFTKFALNAVLLLGLVAPGGGAVTRADAAIAACTTCWTGS